MAITTSAVDQAKNLLRGLLPQTRVAVISSPGGCSRQSLARDPLYPYVVDIKFFDPPPSAPQDVGNLAKYNYLITYSNHVQTSGNLAGVSQQPKDTPNYRVSAG